MSMDTELLREIIRLRKQMTITNVMFTVSLVLLAIAVILK